MSQKQTTLTRTEFTNSTRKYVPKKLKWPLDQTRAGAEKIEQRLKYVPVNSVFITKKLSQILHEPQEDVCPCAEDILNVYMMKFPRPRVLLNNEFPDIIQDQPDILNI